jgi:hypothetical protein
MSRFTSCAILIALTGSAYAQSPAEPAPGEPQTQAQLAEQLNTEGRELMYANKPAEAAEKFRQAIARDAEARFFLNLCTAQLTAGKLGEALTACNNVELNRPSAEQKDKAAKLITRIKEEAATQNLTLVPEGGGASGDTGRPPGPNGATPPPTVGRPLGTNLVVAAPPDNRYTWTLGIDAFGGAGQIGQKDAYGTTFAGFRVKADYLVDPVHRLGGEAYLQYSHLGPGKDDMLGAETLDIFDLGIAGFKNWCLLGTPRLCITPLLGVHLSLMSPAGQSEIDQNGNESQVFNYAAIGGRAEVSMDFAFGRRYEHVLSVMGGLNAYSQVLTGPSDDPKGFFVALDKGGAAGYLGFGYTYRFNTPLGGVPFVVLE